MKDYIVQLQPYSNCKKNVFSTSVL